MKNAIEDFEDGSLDPFITASVGGVINGEDSLYRGNVDSVGGSGSSGHSWWTGQNNNTVTFTFDSPVQAAGLAWTDGFGDVTFEAFKSGGSLGTSGHYTGDTVWTGTTAEDRFFGVTDDQGITAISITAENYDNGDGQGSIPWAQEVDHIVYGNRAPIPEPSTMILFGFGLLCLTGVRKKS